VAALLGPLVALMRARLLLSRAIHSDDTAQGMTRLARR
jgi:hypothetical protein